MKPRPAVRAFGAAVVIAMLTFAGCARAVAPYTDDATITTRVKTALLNDRTVNGSSIDVSTANGVVTLSGKVRSPGERERAMAIARSPGGVADVKSMLQIDGAAGR
jgi:hyperosmotically inducible protein